MEVSPVGDLIFVCLQIVEAWQIFTDAGFQTSFILPSGDVTLQETPTGALPPLGT